MRLGAALSLLLATFAAVPASVLALPVRSETTSLQRRDIQYNTALLARAVADELLSRRAVQLFDIEAREDPPSYSEDDPEHGPLPKYHLKDPNPAPRHHKHDPAKSSTTPPRSLEFVDGVVARTLGKDHDPGPCTRTSVDMLEECDKPPPYSPIALQHERLPGYKKKDPYPRPKYHKHDWGKWKSWLWRKRP